MARYSLSSSPAKGALHEAVEEILQLLLGLTLLGAQGFDFLD